MNAEHKGSILRVVPPRALEHDKTQAEIVTSLKNLMDRATEGEFEQIAFVATSADGSVTTCWHTFYENPSLQGALVNLTHKLAQQWNED